MAQEPGAAPLDARLHPNRGPGLSYGVLAALVFAIVVSGVVSNLMWGQPVFAVLLLVGGVAVAGFLTLLSAAILGPSLTVGSHGVLGRVSWRRRVELTWDQVSITAPSDPPRARFELDLGVESFELSPRTWVGFGDLVLVLATTPAALERMSTPAIDELVRLLDVEGPTTTADVPEV